VRTLVYKCLKFDSNPRVIVDEIQNFFLGDFFFAGAPSIGYTVDERRRCRTLSGVVWPTFVVVEVDVTGQLAAVRVERVREHAALTVEREVVAVLLGRVLQMNVGVTRLQRLADRQRRRRAPQLHIRADNNLYNSCSADGPARRDAPRP